MKKLLIIPLILLLASCAGIQDLTRTESAPTYGTKGTNDEWSATEHNELYNSVVAHYGTYEVSDDCSEITEGLCWDSDNEVFYYWDGSAVQSITNLFRFSETDQVDDLTEETPSDTDLLIWEDVTTGSLRSVPIADVPGLGTASITASADPDVDSESTLTHDTNDEWLRCYDDDTGEQWICGLKNPSIQGTIATPNSYSDALRDFFPIWRNTTGATFTITGIYVQSDTDNTTLEFLSYPGPTNWTGTSIATMDATDNGTNCYYTSTTSIVGDDDIATGEGIAINFNDTDTPGVVVFQLIGWFDADVN